MPFAGAALKPDKLIQNRRYHFRTLSRLKSGLHCVIHRPVIEFACMSVQIPVSGLIQPFKYILYVVAIGTATAGPADGMSGLWVEKLYCPLFFIQFRDKKSGLVPGVENHDLYIIEVTPFLEMAFLESKGYITQRLLYEIVTFTRDTRSSLPFAIDKKLSEIPPPLFDFLKGADHYLSLIGFPGFGDFSTSADDWLLTGIRHVCNGAIFCAAVLLAKDERFVEEIRSTSHHHSYRFEKRPRGLHFAYGIPGSCDCGEGTIGLSRVGRCQLSRPGVIAIF